MFWKLHRLAGRVKKLERQDLGLSKSDIVHGLAEPGVLNKALEQSKQKIPEIFKQGPKPKSAQKKKTDSALDEFGQDALYYARQAGRKDVIAALQH